MPGCSPEGLEQIARRGMRLDETTEGHGLGLAIAGQHRFVLRRGIRYGRSQELGGLEVTVTFPARLASPPALTRGTRLAPAARRPNLTRSRPRKPFSLT